MCLITETHEAGIIHNINVILLTDCVSNKNLGTHTKHSMHVNIYHMPVFLFVQLLHCAPLNLHYIFYCGLLTGNFL